jgi:hypothetical protein
MDAEQLRNLQAPLKSRYREEPDSAVITLKASGELGAESITCKVETAGPWSRPACIRRPAATGCRSAPATCCWRRWSPAPA